MYLAEVSPTAAPAPAENPWQSLVRKFGESLPALTTGYTQIRLMEENLKRAKAGLPPIDSASIAPTVRVQAEVDPELKRNVNLALLAVVGIGAMFALSALFKKR